jgi:hypothetical protein
MPRAQSTESTDQPKDEASREVQKAFDEAEEKGYFGTVPDPHPNSAYSLESGPAGVPLVEDNQTRVAQATNVSKEK